ncbi:hypothetical protein Glove_325g41 [Diversispora epigaea]|uniref:DEK-C domain-containing protein n=1 Tax=Diversispora epigaea TaxID=1348612 RepID=A0A397HN80_9GLOM|nr:hypothetical protein Glove_325g41 [Diversispora epigaea]
MNIDLSRYILSITKILLNSDLNTVTPRDVRSRLEQNFNIDLTLRKNEVKRIVQLCYDKICEHDNREKKMVEGDEEKKEVLMKEVESEKELKNKCSKRKRDEGDEDGDEGEITSNNKKKKIKKNETGTYKNFRKTFNKKRTHFKTNNKYLNNHPKENKAKTL